MRRSLALDLFKNGIPDGIEVVDDPLPTILMSTTSYTTVKDDGHTIVQEPPEHMDIPSTPDSTVVQQQALQQPPVPRKPCPCGNKPNVPPSPTNPRNALFLDSRPRIGKRQAERQKIRDSQLPQK